MDSPGIFVSHGHKYADMAKSLKTSLLSLRSNKSLNVMLSEEMPAGREWRKWIDDNVRAADVFVLLYPHTSMDMNWCNYEIGRFYQRDDNVVCIRNTNIAKSPPVFEPYQAIEGDPTLTFELRHRHSDYAHIELSGCGLQRKVQAQYAMEIGTSGFLGGSVTLRDRVVVRVQKPVLQ